MANPNTLGKYLRERRFMDGLTMKEVSQKTGITQSELCNIELGKKFSPSIDVIQKLSAHYKVPILELAQMIDLPNHKVYTYIRMLKGESLHEKVDS